MTGLPWDMALHKDVTPHKDSRTLGDTTTNMRNTPISQGLDQMEPEIIS